MEGGSGGCFLSAAKEKEREARRASFGRILQIVAIGATSAETTTRTYYEDGVPSEEMIIRRWKMRSPCAEAIWLLCGFLFPQLRRAGLSLISQPSWYSTGQRAKESNTDTRPLIYLDGQSIGSGSRNIAFLKSYICMWLVRSLHA
jgi:hypothetical protein